MADSSNTAPFGGNLSQDKGKGKAVQEDVSMGEDTEVSSDESGPEDVPVEAEEEEDDTTQDPISTDNIIQGGRRTRGKTIDFAEAAAKAQAAGDDPMDDDDDDEDFRAAEEDDDDNAMKH